MSHALQPAYEDLQQARQSNPEQRPQKIADAVADLLDLPFGEKPFRTIVFSFPKWKRYAGSHS